MYVRGRERLMQELEEFTVKNLGPHDICPDNCNLCEAFPSTKERFQRIVERWNWRKCRIGWRGFVQSSQLTNHEICHKMFRHALEGCPALEGCSKMYIQVKDLRHDQEREMAFYHQSAGEDRVVTLSCSLLTTQMLDYDTMMFEAMSDEQDMEYREAAQRFYRPYLFSYVMELDEKKYDALRKLQERVAEESRWENNESDPYLWLANVIKLVRKDVRQRARGLKKEQKELREGKIDSKPRRSGLRLKKECEEGFSVRRRSRRKCGCP